MLEKSKRQLGVYHVERIVNEARESRGVDDPSAKEVLEYMLGDDYGRCGEYAVYKYDSPSKRNFTQRINLLWFWPLYLITIPFQYLFRGQVGMNRNSKVGKIVERIVRF